MQPEHDDFQTEKHLYSLAQSEINMEPKQMMMEPIISQGGSCFNQGIIGCPILVPCFSTSFQPLKEHLLMLGGVLAHFESQHIPWKSKTKQRMVFRMIHIKDSLLPMGKVWSLDSLGIVDV